MSQRILIASMTLALTLLPSVSVWAEQLDPAVGPPVQAGLKLAEMAQVELGIGGVWKLGHVCPLRVRLPSSVSRSASQLEVLSIDGDGVEVAYRTPIHEANVGADGSVWLPIRVGRRFSNLMLRVTGRDGLLVEQQFDSESIGRVLTSSQPLVVAIGSLMGVEELSLQSADGGSATLTTVVLEDPASVPLDWLSYSSVDVLVLSCADVGLLESLTAQQWQAMDAWLRRGGSSIISLGGQADRVAGLEPLGALLPGAILGSGTIRNPAALESLVSTEQPLQAFPCSLVALTRGKVELRLTDSLAREVPWWVSYSHGHGTLFFVASDLGHESWSSWSDRKRLWDRLITPFVDRTAREGVEMSQVGESSYLGYSDLVGQLRATLDVFPDVTVVSFGQVAAILVGILVLIGPVDYFLSVRLFKRPELSWVLAGLMLLGITAMLTWWYATIRPREVHVNTVQVVDVDAANGRINGRLWSHLYSGAARQLDVEVRSLVSSAPIRVDWQGLPGSGLGGLLSQFSADQGMPTYVIDQHPDGQSQISHVGVPAAGTKVFHATWMDEVVPAAESRLREIPGVDQLEGELANPLNVDLLDPVLYYHNWYYSLNSRIPAGQSTIISFDTIPKDLARRLNGRRTVDGNETTTKWDPTDRNSIDRLLELMMFHKAAAGRTYTSLLHRYEPLMDHSNLLQTDRAILLGRVAEPWAGVLASSAEAADGDETLQVRQDLNRVWCRIAIPVAQNDKYATRK